MAPAMADDPSAETDREEGGEPEPEAPRPALLGEIAVELNFLEAAALEALLHELEGRTSYIGIGETLVFRGHITRHQLDVLLTEQARRLGGEGDRLFGQLAIDEGLVSSNAVDRALSEQRRRRAEGMRSSLGTILIEWGLLDPSDVERILALQVERALKLSD
jgi:hypothetical protein